MVIQSVLQYGLPGLTESNTGWVHQTSRPPCILRISVPVPSVLIRRELLQSAEMVTKTSQRWGKTFQNLPVCFLSLLHKKEKKQKDPDLEQILNITENVLCCAVLRRLLLMSKPNKLTEATGNRNNYLVLPNIPQMSSVSGRLAITANERGIPKSVHRKQAWTLQMQTPE